MPIVRIDVTGPRSDEYCSAVLRGVRSAVVEGLGAPDERVNVRLVLTPAALCDLPSCRTDRFTVVDVLMFAGRTDAAKAACSELLRASLEADPGIPACDVAIAYHDMTPADLDVRAGEQPTP